MNWDWDWLNLTLKYDLWIYSPSIEECENKAKAKRLYNVLMDEYKMKWWIMNLRMIGLDLDLWWLIESDRNHLIMERFLGHPSMRKDWARLDK